MRYGFQHPALEQSDVQWIAASPWFCGTSGLQAIAVLIQDSSDILCFGLYSVVVPTVWVIRLSTRSAQRLGMVVLLSGCGSRLRRPFRSVLSLSLFVGLFGRGS